jgi:hypothetical protein
VTARSYLPSLRRGLGAALPVVDTLGNDVPGRAGVPLDVTVADGVTAPTAIRVPLRLSGPGDVTGLDPAQILRTDPRPGTPDFEPNLLVSVEFERPDLPWLFTPARGDDRGRVRPWLVCVVIEDRGDVLRSEPGVPLPVLEAPVSELPNLYESWAWAHAQEAPAPLSRLVCPRRLRSQASYLACVVPAFAAGRRAGLGEPAVPEDDAALAPAWEGTGTARLPVYHQWRFATGPGGDFEALAGRVRPRALPPGVGTLALELGAPQWGVPARTRKSLPLTGALQRPGNRAEREDDVEPELRAALRAALEGQALPPPLYGQWYTREAGAPPDSAPGGWLRDLNLDPRARAAAGLGALVVRYEQERLMASAWEQLAEHERDEGAVTRAQLAESVSTALGARLDQPAAAELTETPRFAPTFEQPMYEALRDWFPGMLLTGLSDVPPNTVALLETNPRFIEAFLVGLNHELSRELAWRGYPTDRRGTYFSRFWDGAPPLPPIRAWPATSRLGEHLGGPAAGTVVLIVRGDLLARFPQAGVFAVEAAWGPSGRVPGTRRLAPSFRGHAADVTFLGFPLTHAQARGGLDRAGHPGWFFVIEEPPAQARFGFDEPAEDAPPRPVGAIAAWSDLTWADVGTAPGRHIALRGPLEGKALPERPGGVTAAWAHNSAHMAVIAQQRPFRVAIHAGAWLPEVPPA